MQSPDRTQSPGGETVCGNPAEKEIGENMRENQKPELLAPAGSPEAFYGVIGAGADAVYLGGMRFGARAYAENFTEEELVDCIRFARLFKVKVYVTVNTLLTERELEELPGYLAPLSAAGLDGVIVQDLGVLSVIRREFPALKLHASTQTTICSAYGAGLLKSLGVCRVVPARELSLSETAGIKQETGLEMETFIHGAMCYCYSGQCLFSSILGGRSGNRGRCAQPCRLPFGAEGKGGAVPACYPLSMKDLCAIELLPALTEAGMDSFKIEGRMKKPEYAAGVTAVYRKYLDRYWENRQKAGAKAAGERFRIEKEDKELLRSLYVRSGQSEGYFFRQNGREMIALEQPAYTETEPSVLKAIRERYLEEKPKLPADIEGEFFVGQPARVRMRLHRKERALEPAESEITAQALGDPVQPAQNRPVTEEELKRQLKKLGDSPFSPCLVTVRTDGQGFLPLQQINRLRRQAAEALERMLLSERGSDVTAREAGGLSPREPGQKPALQPRRKPAFQPRRQEPRYAVSLRTWEQMDALAEWLVSGTGKETPEDGRLGKFWLERLYVDGDLILRDVEKYDGFRIRLKKLLPDLQIFAALPYVFRQRDLPLLETLADLYERGLVDGFLIRSLDELGFFRERGEIHALRTDAGVYAWNSEAVQQLSRFAEGFCLPLELNAGGQRGLLARIGTGETEPVQAHGTEKLIYGRIPLMVTANCIQKTLWKCNGKHDGKDNGKDNGKDSGKDDRKCNGKDNGKDDGILWLTDRMNKRFPVVRNCSCCYNLIYNCVPLALWEEKYSMPGVDVLRLDFTVETGKELAEKMNACLASRPLKPGSYTTGHEKRGVQ